MSARPARRARPAAEPAPPPRDLNMDVACALYDLSMVHASKHARIAYSRAAKAILRLEDPVDAIAPDALREVRFIGPASERVVREVLDAGRSATVERAVAGSGRAGDVERARPLRANFLSRAAARAVLAAPAPAGVVGAADHRGDLQTHTEWSDGSETVAEMAAAARARGHAFLGTSDHSYGLRIAGGMSMEDAGRQRREIDAVNAAADDGFRVFHGIEANLTATGDVDMTDDELATFEIVLAAPHSLLRKSHDQTDRMLAAVRHPRVHVLAHPRGRMFTRQGVLADWPRVFAAAADAGTAIELDGDPWRQDLDWTLARDALDAGCTFALDSDAHSGRELAYTEYALAHARLAGIPAARIVNCGDAADVAAWAAAKRSRRARAARRAG